MPVGVSAGSCHSAFCQLVPPRCHTSSSHTSSPVTHRKSMCLRHSEAKRWEFGAEKGLLQVQARIGSSCSKNPKLTMVFRERFLYAKCGKAAGCVTFF